MAGFVHLTFGLRVTYAGEQWRSSRRRGWLTATEVTRGAEVAQGGRGRTLL